MNADDSKTEKERDFELLDRCLAGNEQAEVDLAVRIKWVIWRCVFHKARKTGLRYFYSQDAEDLCQDILLDLFKDDMDILRRFQRRSSLVRWIEVVVQNALIDIKRSVINRDDEKTESFDGSQSLDPDAQAWEDLLADVASTPLERVLYDERVASVRRVVHKILSLRDRDILTMWATRTYTYVDIGALFGLSGDGVGTIIHRAIRDIKQALKEQEAESV